MGFRYHIIKAGAGAGKTRKLVLKFLDVLFRLYKNRSEFFLNKILAITFTNAAADEMRDRVIKILKKLSIPELPIRDMEGKKIEEFENLLKTYALTKFDTSKILDYIIHNYSDLEIKTIDSFVNSLILSVPFSAGVFLTPQMDIANPEFYINYACDLLIKKYGTDDRTREVIDNFIDALLNERNEKISWYVKDDLSRKTREFRRSEMNLAEEIDFNFYSQIDSVIKDATFLKSVKKYAPYVALYKNVNEEIEVLKRKRRVVFIDELNMIARNIMKNVADPLIIFEKLGEKILYFMIDEFQDTSRVQWENLFNLIENALSEGGEFFCVGDSKQAIYGFRGGEPELFEDLFLKPPFRSISESERKTEKIEENYRSVKEIIDFNNRVFNSANLKNWLRESEKLKDYIDEDIVNKIGMVYDDSSQKVVRKDKGFLLVEKIEKQKGDEEGEYDLYERILKRLNDFRVFERFSKSDICFLLRKTEDVQKWTSFLLSKGIPVESTITTDVRENFLLRELVELLRFFDRPYDNFSLASFITGKLFEKVSGIDSEDFYRWIEKNKKYKAGLLYLRFKEEYRELWDMYFSEPFRAVGYLPLYDFLIMVMNKFRVYDLFPESTPFLKYFEEIVYSFEGKGISTTGEFLKKWDKRGEDEESAFILHLPIVTDAVKVMTIHKAKGLQFPVVVIPKVSLTLNDKIFKAEFMPHKDEGGIRFYYSKKDFRKGCEKLKEVYKKHLLKGLTEEINCLYVAMTRAEDELYAFLLEGKGAKNLYIPLILGEASEKREGEPVAVKKKPPEKEEELPALPPRRRWDLKFVRERRGSEEIVDERRKRAMLTGEGIHLVLSKIKGVSSEEELERALKENFKILQKNPDFIDLKKELSDVLLPLVDFLKRVASKFFLVPSERVFTEKEVLGSDGRVRRIDRLIVFEDRVEVVDFKWGEKKEKEHRAQIEDYMALLSQIYQGKRVRGFLIYLDSEKVEEVN